eukprot:scaffold8232_cov191-Pinguiococcus_pyrenoidosus.AAC.1
MTVIGTRRRRGRSLRGASVASRLNEGRGQKLSLPNPGKQKPAWHSHRPPQSCFTVGRGEPRMRLRSLYAGGHTGRAWHHLRDDDR